MDPKQAEHAEKIIRKQVERLDFLREKLRDYKSLDLTFKIKILSELAEIKGVLTTMMAVAPQPIVDHYAPYMSTIRDFTIYAVDASMRAAEDLQGELDSAYAVMEESIKREKKPLRVERKPAQEEKKPPKDEMEVRDIFGRKINPEFAGLRHRRR